MDPYETLGVPRTADQATIKRAGKRKKVASHPDHGGDREKYEAASRALVVLTDPLRKHHFDTTGEADFEPVDPHRQAVTDIIMPVLDMAINEALAHPGDHKFDVERMADLIERVRFIIQKQINASLAAKAKTLTQADKIERVAKRFKKRGGGMSVIYESLMAKAGNMRFQAKAADQVVYTNTLAQNILDEHSFEAIVEDFGYTFANRGLLMPREVQ